MSTPPPENADKENTTPTSPSTQQDQPSVRVGQDSMMKLLESICEPSSLQRTKSGNGFLVNSDAMRKIQHGRVLGQFAMKRVKLPERNEKHTKSLPFNSRVMEQYLDLDNCTYAVIGTDSPLGEVLRGKNGTTRFAKSAFLLNSRYHEVDPYDDLDDEEFAEIADEKELDNRKNKKPLTTPSLPLGVHETIFENHRIVLLYQEIGDPVGGGYGGPRAPKSMVLFTEGRNNLAPIQAFAEVVLKENSDAPQKQNFHLYRWQHGCGYWKKISSEKARPMNSVILPPGFRESVELDMKRFLSKRTRQWYDRRGIPYKRCYMFFGVPGTGKTSLITALAGRFRRNVCFLSAHHPKFTDEALKTALSRLPSRAIVVLEDIDSLFDKDRKTNNNNNPLTFTGLLNAVDGIGEHRGTIFVMTTNFIDRLDSALIRAGRVDMKVEFKKADDHQLQEYFKWFYDDEPEQGDTYAPLFVKACRVQFPDGVTMAELQQHFVDNMYATAEVCVDNLKFYDLPLLQKQAAAEEEKRRKEAEKKKAEEEKKKKDGEKEDAPDDDDNGAAADEDVDEGAVGDGSGDDTDNSDEES